MATVIEDWSKTEVRGVIRFLHAKGTKPSDIHGELVTVYGNNVMSKKQVYAWCSKFSEGRSNLDDDPRPGRKQTSSSDNNVMRVEALIRGDRRLKVREMALDLGLPKTIVHRIINELGYRKVSARWVPKQLTEDHKLKRSESAEETVGPDGDFRGDTGNRGFLGHLITGDETWVHHMTPERKMDSMTWKHPSSPPAKKFKVQQSAKKLMATVFWDAQGILLVDFLPPGETINAARYCQTLNKLREAVRRKRPGRLTEGVILQHDNATPHTANITKDWLRKYGWEVLIHPPHSPDLAPSDYHLFGPLKRHLAGQRFHADEDLIEEVRMWLQSLEVTFFREGIFSLMYRWRQKCID